MNAALRGLFWAGVYVLVVVAPLGLALAGPAVQGHGFTVDLSVALGFLGLSIMALQFALVARLQRVSAPFGMDALLQYHRQIGYVALVFLLAHPVMLFIEDPQKLALLNPVTAPWRARFAVASVVALLALVGTSVWRKRLRISYEAWQVAHGVLAVVTVALGLAHAAKVGRYLGSTWQRALWIALSAALVGLLGWVRIWKPIALFRRPWRVEEVVAERGNAWTVVLRPEGHAGLRFTPGQFGWLVLGHSPFAPTQHPFSFSSSAEEAGRIAFTIKARGDFTSSIAKIAPGARAYVDGPHGLFSIDEDEGPGFVLIAGGVGITPIISMIRTMADREDTRPILLFYANRDWNGVTFREELDALAKRTNLRVVHALEVPEDGWTGEKGYVDTAMLKRHLPRRFERMQYFVCGPGPMMDAMERALHAAGVPDERVHTERFDMV